MVIVSGKIFLFSITEALMPIYNTPIFIDRSGIRSGVLLHGNKAKIIEIDFKRGIFVKDVIIHLFIIVFTIKVSTFTKREVLRYVLKQSM